MAGVSFSSVLSRVFVPAAGPAPVAPENLRQDPATTTYAMVGLLWDAPPDVGDETNAPVPVVGYFVYRQAPGGAWVRLTPEPITTTSFADAGRDPGTAYTYRVVAVSAGRAQSAPITTTAQSKRPPARRRSGGENHVAGGFHRRPGGLEQGQCDARRRADP